MSRSSPGNRLRRSPPEVGFAARKMSPGSPASSTLNRMSRHLTYILAVLLFAPCARAAVCAGTGFSTATSGRPIPALTAGYLADTWAVTGLATGVSASLYYHSAWTLHAYRMMDAGAIGWGELRAGFGGGIYYAKRGYRETREAAIDTADDFNFGPAFRVSWHFLSPAYFAVEGMFGLRKPLPVLGLAVQDMAHLAFGVEF